jgi:hypothetical protein
VAADPVVPGFVLPESGAGAGEEAVGSACGSAFQPEHDLGDGDPGFEDHVDVVGHDAPGVEIVQMASGGAVE